MRKLSIAAALMGVVVLCYSAICVAAEKINLIDNGDFENGTARFGICYSSREDTALPSVRYSDTIFESGGVLQMLPGETLSSKASNSPVSSGISYQGIYHKNTFDVKKDVKYTISADVYAMSENVKMRFIVIQENRAIKASEEMSVLSADFGKNTFGWVPDADYTDVRVRLAFYNIEFGKSIYIDNFVCNEAVISSELWQPIEDETITTNGETVEFTTTAGRENGIFGSTSASEYKVGEKYGLIGTVTTSAEKAYLSIEANNPGRDYIVENGDNIKFIVPFEVNGGENVIFNITALTEGNSTVTFEKLEVVDKYGIVDVKRDNDDIVVSGRLRAGNENKQIAIQLGEMGSFNVTTNSEGEYSFKREIPEISVPRVKIRVAVSNINGYSDLGGVLFADYVLYNNTYIDDVAAMVSGKTKAQIETILTEEVLDDIGVSVIPAFKTSDKEHIFTYISGKTIANGRQLCDDITVAAVFSSLDAKLRELCRMTDEYAELLKVDELDSYKNFYNKAEKSTLNAMFNQCSHKISDLGSYKYALSETLIRYEMKSKVNYSQQIGLLQKYADELNIDFSKYNKLASDKKYSVATALLSGIHEKTDYSFIQSELDRLVAAANEDAPIIPGGGGSGGGGGGGSVGGNTQNAGGSSDRVGIADDAIEQAKAENAWKQYRFADLEGFSWAEDSIYKLVEKNVISKPENKLFNPGNYVTRAEFAKMAAVLFGVNKYTHGVEKFGDVKKSDWYYQYVMALYEKGVIYGISEKTFGSNNPVTRQDICVILERLLEKEPENTEIVFTDIADADNYAKNAIGLMKKLGVINGYEDGTFRPKAFATRAEIARMLCKMEGVVK